MTNWKPPRITERTANYTKRFDGMTDAEKLEHFDNIVGAAFRKGYNVRKGDERKMRGENVHNACGKPPREAASETPPPTGRSA